MALLIAGGGTQVFTSNACTCAAVSLLQGCSNCCCCRTFCLLLNGPASVGLKASDVLCAHAFGGS
eukprot:1157405-Pelagomonas_calceolata.AAC.1